MPYENKKYFHDNIYKLNKNKIIYFKEISVCV